MSLISENTLHGIVSHLAVITGRITGILPFSHLARVSGLFYARNLILAMILLPVITLSCTGEGRLAEPFRPENKEINHARGFDIEESGDFTFLTVHNPWQGAGHVTFRYVLAGRDTDTGLLPPEMSGIPVIRTPVASVICLSTTHIAMLDLIGETNTIVAVSGGEYIFNEIVRSRLENGELPDIGYDMNLDYERILELSHDVILAYGVDQEAVAWLDRLQGLGLNVVMIGEYLEDSPLGQAEWVKFVARLFGKQKLAEEKFGDIEEEYMELAQLAASKKARPVVMSGLPWRGSWFVPGGNSHFSRLITDAGGRYLWSGNPGRDNFPVGLERVLEQASVADYWINTGSALSLSDIENTDKRLAGLKPCRNGKVYNNNARLNRSGGNDYWESGIVNPHIILRDLIHILHPPALPEHEPLYYRQL